ncbi:MAG: diguanylate cyclase [Dokdonella sp.]
MPLVARVLMGRWNPVRAVVLSWLFSSSAVAASPAREVVAGPPQTIETQLRWQTYRRFASREGLPRNWVTALAQDGEGFILAGTEEGLARYDGQHWGRALFPLDPAARQPYVNALATAADGSVWVGTDTAGLFVYRDGKLDDGPLSRAAARDIENIYADPDHGMWIGTVAGMFLCDDDHCNAIEDTQGLNVKRILPTQDASGEHVYVGTADSGVYRIDDPYRAPRRSDWHLNHAAGLPGDSIGALIEWGGAAGKDLWVGTVQGVARLAGDRLVVYADASGFPDGVTGLVRVPQRDGSEKLIATMPVGGLVEFSEDGHWRRTTTANGLPENAVNAAMLTDAGQSVPVLWLGSGHSGVLRAEPQTWSSFAEHDGLPNRIVYAIGEARFLDDKDALWIGTADGSVRWSEGQWRSWLPAAYAHSEVFDIVREADRLWVATRQGVLLLSRSGVREYTTANSALPDNAVAGMHLQTSGDDAAGTLWLGTHRGIARIRNDRLERETVPGVPSNFFVRVLRSTNDRAETIVWAGAEQGLFYRRANAWRKLECGGLIDTAVFDLRERGTPEHDHLLWAATFNGVVRIDLDKDFSCTSLSLPASVQASSIYQIQFDDRDRMYLFGAYGVTRLTVGSDARPHPDIERFDLADGLPDLEFSRASLVDSQGRVWGGSIDGAAMYDPSAEARTTTPRPLHVLAVTDEQSGKRLHEGADLAETESNVAFDLSLLAYQRDYRTRYRSQLLGLEDRAGDWMESPHRSYSRLPAGDYIFQAWARDADAVESGPVAWRFRVHAPWWRRTWAFGLYALALVLVGLFFGRLRARALAGRARALQQEVAERTRALAEANRQLAHASLTDPLTGLWNRRFFNLEFPPECERAIRRVTRNEPAADLIFVLADVDHFKQINDQYGHGAGDAVLIELARRIRSLLRTGDVAVRWGGEEFLIVLRDAERANAEALASRLREAVAATPFDVRDDHIHVNCSIGWAAYPFDPEAPRRHSVDQLITFADAALYRAKHGGRNRVVGAIANSGAPSTSSAEFILIDAQGHALPVESPPE